MYNNHLIFRHTPPEGETRTTVCGAYDATQGMIFIGAVNLLTKKFVKSFARSWAMGRALKRPFASLPCENINDAHEIINDNFENTHYILSTQGYPEVERLHPSIDEEQFKYKPITEKIAVDAV